MGLISKPLPGAFLNRLQPISEGIAACYLFNTGAGSQLWDYANPYKNGNHGTLYGPTWVPGRDGWALDFDSVSNDYVNIGAPLEFNSTKSSVVIWYKSPSSASIRTLFGIGVDNLPNDRWGLLIRGDDIIEVFNQIEGVTQLITGTNVADGNWHQVAGVITGSKHVLYEDGVKQNEGNSIKNWTNLGSRQSYIGALQKTAPSPGFTFDGLIGKSCVYNRALSATEIAQLYYEQYAMFQQAVNPAVFFAPAVAGAIMNQFQGPNLGADLYNGMLM